MARGGMMKASCGSGKKMKAIVGREGMMEVTCGLERDNGS